MNFLFICLNIYLKELLRELGIIVSFVRIVIHFSKGLLYNNLGLQHDPIERLTVIE